MARVPWLMASLLGCACGSASTSAPRTAPFDLPKSCDAPEYHRLDFWIGEWDVRTPDGALDGTNVVRPIVGGCAIEEQWTDAQGSTGRSLFYFDRAAARWKQVWVTSAGGWKEKQEIPDKTRSIRFQGEVPTTAGGAAIDRTTLTPLDDGRVDQVIERSTDGGATWTRWEGLYARSKSAPACSDASHRSFDFWIGDWDLVVRARRSPTSEEWDEARATNEIRPTHGGCVIEERFRASGPGDPWSGSSMSAFVDGKWRQTWVDDQGSYMLFVGGWTGSEMILEGEPRERDGKKFRMRMVFTEITPRALRWRWERTEDDGASWRAAMTIEYRRRS